MMTSRAMFPMFAAAFVLLAISPAALAADDLFIEGEEYETYGSNDLGGVAIGTEFCSGASGFFAAGGLDVPGEWLRLKVTFPAPGCYTSTVAYQSGYGDHVQTRVRIAEAPVPGQELTADYWFTDGWGFG
ncbi:MAG: hypothetical protein ABIG03_00780 [Candidatus Eisenbacteria bacterium]